MHWDLLHVMLNKEFVAFVPHDENRLGDGLDLRSEFCHEHRLRPTALRNLGPGSFLEVLIGLSRRLSFNAGGPAPDWAWRLITNLGLDRYSDPLSQRKLEHVGDILDTCIRRTYKSSGEGGFFPLSWPEEDQTKIELWYQMAAYIDELHPEH